MGSKYFEIKLNEISCSILFLLAENIVCYWSQSSDENSLNIADIFNKRTAPLNVEDQFLLPIVDDCTNSWTSNEKIVFIIPTYHRSLTIKSPSFVNIADTAGPVKNWTRERENQQEVLYTENNHLFGYNDIERMRINQKNFRQAMFWSL